MKGSINLKKSLLYLSAAIYLVITGYPLIWLFYTSLKTNAEIFQSTWALPKSLRLINYWEVWSGGLMGRYYFNSIYVSSLSVFLILALSSLAGYLFARLRFSFRERLFYLFLAGMMIPVHVTLIPLHVLLRWIGLLDTYTGLIAPYVGFGLPVSIFILRSFFETIPLELEDAALIDGCSRLGVFLKIMLPLSKPAISSVTIFNLVTVWNEFVFALVFVSSPLKRTIPLGLMEFYGEFSTDIAKICTALSLATIPVLIIYFLAQKHIIKGLTAGALKG